MPSKMTRRVIIGGMLGAALFGGLAVGDVIEARRAASDQQKLADSCHKNLARYQRLCIEGNRSEALIYLRQADGVCYQAARHAVEIGDAERAFGYGRISLEVDEETKLVSDIAKASCTVKVKDESE